MKKSVTMKEIADALDTSVVTVSNALTGKKGVSEIFRMRILEKAAKLGYDFTGIERKKSTKAFTLGIISARRYTSENSSFYWEMYQRTVDAAAERGGLTMLEIFDDEEGGLELPILVRKEGIDGFIVIGQIKDVFMKRMFQAVTCPVVLLDFYHVDYPCDAVLSENYLGMYRVTRYLTEYGHKKIGFIGTGRLSRNVTVRYYGYCRCMLEQGLPINPKWLLEERELVSEDPKILLPVELPTAFACSSDYTAGILYRLLAKRGLRVPEDISLIGYDDYLYNNSFSERLTSYHVDMEGMAREAVDLVLKRRTAPLRPFCIRHIDSYIVERSSVARV